MIMVAIVFYDRLVGSHASALLRTSSSFNRVYSIRAWVCICLYVIIDSDLPESRQCNQHVAT